MEQELKAKAGLAGICVQACTSGYSRRVRVHSVL